MCYTVWETGNGMTLAHLTTGRSRGAAGGH